jgi:quercetin dioxygenase-like cupin family protein
MLALLIQPMGADVSKHHIRLLSALTLALVASTPGIAQQPLTPSPQLYASKPIMVSPLSGDEKKEVVLLSVTIQPSGAVPMHSHPGDCVGSVVEGTVELLMEGQPPKRISAGEGYSNLRGTVHGFRNVAETQAKLLNNLVIDKGAPRIQPATQGPMQ